MCLGKNVGIRTIVNAVNTEFGSLNVFKEGDTVYIYNTSRK